MLKNSPLKSVFILNFQLVSTYVGRILSLVALLLEHLYNFCHVFVAYSTYTSALFLMAYYTLCIALKLGSPAGNRGLRTTFGFLWYFFIFFICLYTPLFTPLKHETKVYCIQLCKNGKKSCVKSNYYFLS